jgi:hypothetical protein
VRPYSLDKNPANHKATALCFEATMITLKFKDFMDGNYKDDFEANLYLLKDGEKVLYIGITTQDIWNRWFDSRGSHIFRNSEGDYLGWTDAGKFVVKNIPVSLDWIIELYTPDDCKKILEEEFGIAHVDRFDIRFCESVLIAKFKPSLNARCG